MNPHFEKPIEKLVIIGVGLIGGSAALALREGRHVKKIVGVGRSLHNLEIALNRQIIDEIETNLLTAIRGAEVVLITTPVRKIGEILAQLNAQCDPHTLIIDAGSTKQNIIHDAKEFLPTQIGQFVPCHPIAGAEKSGAEAAYASLFQKRHVIITPLFENAPEMIQRAHAFWEQCGASVTSMSAEQHDEVFAAVSHLPHLLAFSFMETVGQSPNRDDYFHFAGTGFRDFTRIAGSHPEMWRDIVLSNREFILAGLNAYRQTLCNIQDLIETRDSEAIVQFFNHAQAAHQEFMHQHISPCRSSE